MTKAFSTAALQQALATQLARLPDDPAFQNVRRDAFSQFVARGLPTANDEAWHYTRLDPRQTTDLDLAAADNLEGLASNLAINGLGEPSLTFAGGLVHRKETLASQAQLATLATLWSRKEGADLLETQSDQALAVLNTALASDGGLIEVPAATQVAEPLYCLFAATAGQSQSRLLVHLEENASLDLVLHHAGQPATAGWNNLVIDVHQATGSKLTVYRLNELGSDYSQTEQMTVDVAANGKFHLVSADLGARLSRNDLCIRLSGTDASAELDGLFVANQGQHIDNRILLDHAASNTTSRQRFRGIGNHRGRGIFNGKVLVREGTRAVDAQQTSNNLLLAERCEIDTKPELEIYADDVKCSHGATVGELDDDQLYYLQSRGIRHDEARRLLIQAFATTVVERFAINLVAEHVGRALDRQLMVAPGENP
ncbi:MAG: Fe-S cluster assembly protein SufD [Gammaproteobacteria bacterium]